MRAVVALGSNLGDSAATIQQAFGWLQELSAGSLVKSSLWRTAPVDCPPGSPDFVNAVAILEPFSGESPESLLTKLQELERRAGRRPKKVLNESRPLDLDLILFGMELRNTPELVLPHPRAHLRSFVLEPLAEIAPGLTFPGLNQTVDFLLASLKGAG